LIYTKSDSDYILTVIPVTCVPLLAPNPGDATVDSDAILLFLSMAAMLQGKEIFLM